MLFDWWRKRKKKQQPRLPLDPLAAFDQLLEDLERQGAEVRRSAATLLALKGDLARAEARYLQRMEDMARRQAEATERGDVLLVGTLERDRSQTEALLASTRESLWRAEEDAKLLLEAAAELNARVAELRVEREGASARLAAGGLVSQALRERVERFDKVMAVESARDEVERAHALADIYREQPRALAERSEG